MRRDDRQHRRGPLLIAFALAAAPCGCSELLEADTLGERPELVEAGATVDASRDAPVDAAPDRETPSAFDASGVALLVNPSQIVFTPPVASAGPASPQTATVMNAGTASSPPISASVQLDTTDFYVMQSS